MLTKLQKWFIIGAVWVIAIAMLLGAFRGRYITFGNRFYVTFDTWTGTLYKSNVAKQMGEMDMQVLVLALCIAVIGAVIIIVMDKTGIWKALKWLGRRIKKGIVWFISKYK